MLFTLPGRVVRGVEEWPLSTENPIGVTVTSMGFVAASFEHMVLPLQCNSVSIRLAVIYRPPSQSTKCSDGQFLTEFSDFLQLLVVMGGKMLIVGDFNIHVDVVGNATACKFLSLLDSHGLTQNVLSLTHLDGHTLDLVILRPSDNVVSGCVVSALIEDHFAVHMLVRAHRLVRPQKKITYRELDRIDADLFLPTFSLCLFSLHHQMTLMSFCCSTILVFLLCSTNMHLCGLK